MQSVLIAAFLRWCVDEHGRFRDRQEMKVGAFFRPPGGLTPGTVLFQQYLEQRPDDVRQALTRLVPPSLQTELEVTDWGWLKEFHIVLNLAIQKVTEQLEYYEEQIKKAADERKYGRANALNKILNTIASRDLLSFFSQHNILPKYGFPVDVVQFITDYVEDNDVSERVELQRDLRVALSEFAPGSKLVAAKKIWTGGGIYRSPDKGWEPEAFAICPQCQRFNLKPGDQPISECQCGNTLPREKPFCSGIMIRPEFGFLAIDAWLNLVRRARRVSIRQECTLAIMFSRKTKK